MASIKDPFNEECAALEPGESLQAITACHEEPVVRVLHISGSLCQVLSLVLAGVFLVSMFTALMVVLAFKN